MKCFKSILLCGALALLTSAAQAHPHLFEGTYSFNGNVEPQGRLTVDLIDMRMADAKKRLDELRAQGALCEVVESKLFRCTKMRGAADVAPESLRKIAVRYAGFFVTFSKRFAPPSLVSEGSHVIEWSVPQAGEWNGDRFHSYRYLLMRDSQGDMAKLILNGFESTLELLTFDGRTLKRFDSTIVNESRWRWYVDYATVDLVVNP